MFSRMSLFSRLGLPPGVCYGILLSCVQVVLIALVPTDFNFGSVTIILLLYLVVPLFARLRTAQKAEQTDRDRYIAVHIGLTCATLVTIATIGTYVLSIAGVRLVNSGGFFLVRLGLDLFSSVVVLVILNGAGFGLSLLGGWLGSLFGRIWVHSSKEQRL
jgi:hypothetical protein